MQIFCARVYSFLCCAHIFWVAVHKSVSATANLITSLFVLNTHTHTSCKNHAFEPCSNFYYSSCCLAEAVSISIHSGEACMQHQKGFWIIKGFFSARCFRAQTSSASIVLAPLASHPVHKRWAAREREKSETNLFQRLKWSNIHAKCEEEKLLFIICLRSFSLKALLCGCARK